MIVKVLHRSIISNSNLTGYVGEETISSDDYESRISSGTFEFQLTSGVCSDYDRGRFYLEYSVEDVEHSTEDIKIFSVLDFEVRKRTDGTWVSYSAEQFNCQFLLLVDLENETVYWQSIKDYAILNPDFEKRIDKNSTSVRIHIPREQVLTIDNDSKLCELAKNGHLQKKLRANDLSNFPFSLGFEITPPASEEQLQ